MTSPSSDHDIKTGNKFEREIEFREGSPIQLLRYSEKTENEKFGQILLNPKALDIIKEINEPLAIISVVGSYRRGKSWFANVLRGHHDGFALDAKVEGCTRGIYMWSPPFKLISKQHDDLSKFIQEPENGDFLPRLVILLRDFILESSTCFKDYFLEQMKKINAEATMGIKKFFYDFDVYGLSPLGCKKKMLQHMEEAKTNELDEEFVEEVVNAVESIYSQLPLKYIGSSTMQGISFVKFLENVVERMNSSETLTLLSITSEYESIIQFVAQEAIKESIDRYEKSMSTLRNEEEKLQMHWKEFDKMHLKYKSEINKLFFEKIIGSPAQLSNFVKQLNGEISKSEKRFIEENSKELTTFNKKIAKKSWARHIKIKLDKNDLFRYKEESQEAWKLFESYCNELMIKSPEADEIIALFKNRYMAAVDYNKQLGKINAELTKTIQEEEDKKSQLIICMNEERLRSKIETLKKEREEYERNANNKILELQANIE
ncbi:GBP-domain-containing protein [Rhizophagus irregularis]|nr:GBP-domain-containing protein [Rhizophagus irregularis]